MIMQPTKLQSILYAIGFKPRELRQYQSASNLLATSDKLAAQSRGRDLDEQAQKVLQGDVVGVRDYIQSSLTANPGTDPRAIVHSILDRAADMSNPKDLLATGGMNNAAARRAIASTYPGQVVNRQSELQRLQFREQTLSQLGYPYGTQPAGQHDYIIAALADQLVQSQGLTRAEALKQASLMSGATPSPSF